MIPNFRLLLCFGETLKKEKTERWPFRKCSLLLKKRKEKKKNKNIGRFSLKVSFHVFIEASCFFSSFNCLKTTSDDGRLDGCFNWSHLTAQWWSPGSSNCLSLTSSHTDRQADRQTGGLSSIWSLFSIACCGGSLALWASCQHQMSRQVRPRRNQPVDNLKLT